MIPLSPVSWSGGDNRADDSRFEPVGRSKACARFLTRRRRWPLVLIWLQLLFLATSASALMPPWVYQQARDKAMFHVQVKVVNVTGPTQTPGECSVTGEVVRIFRNTPGTLRQGETLNFTISCSKPGDPVIIGGTMWTDYDSLMKAKYLEVFLNSAERGYEVALWQSHIIAAPTDQPTFPASQVEQRPQ